MTIYRVKMANTELSGERREYIVQAENFGAAEAKALKQMGKDMAGERGKNYAYEAELLGPLVK